MCFGSHKYIRTFLVNIFWVCIFQCATLFQYNSRILREVCFEQVFYEQSEITEIFMILTIVRLIERLKQA